MTQMFNAESSMAGRSGRYTRQPARYRAFIPAPLPPDPSSISMPDSKRPCPARITHWVDWTVRYIPCRTRICSADQRNPRRAPCGGPGSHLAPGKLRTSQNWIGPGGCILAEATFVPPPPHMVPEAMSDLERFLHADEPMPPLIKVGLAHAQFETIHPFLDGNGRIGRLLISFLLSESGLLARPVLYLSHYLRAHRSDYYDHLQRVRDDGRWEEWLTFFLTAVETVSGDAADTAHRVLTMREEARSLVTQHLGRAAVNGLRVLESLFERPLVSVADLAAMLSVTNSGANQLVRRLEDLGLLVELTGFTRNRRFRFAPYLELFDDSLSPSRSGTPPPARSQ
ncbi:MAG TPA: Fic family protein [Actinomycetota bacterium]|nr:Fic family protein [Actinomycetota bacterium]